MMWGPAVAQVAADLTTTGDCDWLDLTDLGPRPLRCRRQQSRCPRTDFATISRESDTNEHD